MPNHRASFHSPTVSFSSASSSSSSQHQHNLHHHSNNDKFHEIPTLDEMLKQYFSFRGFTGTLQSFDKERKNDKSKGFQSEKIVEYIFGLLNNYEFAKFTEYWKYLKENFFDKWSQSYTHSRTAFTTYQYNSNIVDNSVDVSMSHDLESSDYILVNSAVSSIVTNSSASLSSAPSSSALSSSSVASSNNTTPLSSAAPSPTAAMVANAITSSASSSFLIASTSSALSGGAGVQGGSSNSATAASIHAQPLNESVMAGTTNLFDIVRKLEQSLKKFYVVHCIQTNKIEKCTDFFSQYADELCRDKEWKDWFVVPFVKNPEQIPELAPYFSKQWVELLSISLQNFISTSFTALQKPQLLVMEQESKSRYSSAKKKIEYLEKENESLKSKLRSLEKYVEQLETARSMQSELTSTSGVMQESTSIPVGVATAIQNGNEQQGTSQGSTEAATVENSSKRLSTGYSESAKQLFPTNVLAGHKADITQCQFSMEGSYIATASKDKTVRVWYLNSSSAISPSSSLAGSRESRDFSAETNNTGFIPNLSIETNSDTNCLEWNRKQDNTLFCGLNNRKVKIFQFGQRPADKMKLLGEIVTVDSHYPKINAIASSPASRLCIIANSTASGATGGSLCGYNLTTLKCDFKFSMEPKPATVLSARFNHNGKMFVTASSDGMLRVYDVNTQAAIMEWEAHQGPATSAYFSSDETSIVSTGVDGLIAQWSIHKLGKVASFKVPSFSKEKGFLNEPKICLFNSSHDRSACSFMLNDPGILFQRVSSQTASPKFLPSYTMMLDTSDPQKIPSQHATPLSLSARSSVGVIRMRAIDCSPVNELIAGSGVSNSGNCLFLYQVPQQTNENS